jgi:proteic killer suppression protein
MISMNIEFKDKQKLCLIEGSRAKEIALPVPVIVSCRKIFGYIRAAMDERDLRGWKSLHYEKLVGNRLGQSSIKINDKWRLVFRIENACVPPLIVILSVEDYH